MYTSETTSYIVTQVINIVIIADALRAGIFRGGGVLAVHWVFLTRMRIPNVHTYSILHTVQVSLLEM